MKLGVTVTNKIKILFCNQTAAEMFFLHGIHDVKTVAVISPSYPDPWASTLIHLYLPVYPSTCGATNWMCEKLQWVWESGAQTDRLRPALVWMFDSDPPPSSAVRPCIFQLF